MYIVDSSVWVALFLDDDTQHAKAVALSLYIRKRRRSQRAPRISNRAILRS